MRIENLKISLELPMEEKKKEIKESEVIVVGGGPAGVAAAIYLKRAGITPVLIEKGIVGGELWEISIIENYPGFPEPIQGSKLAERFQKQIEYWNIPVVQDEITNYENSEGKIFLKGRRGEYKAEGLIIATGGSHRELGVPGEMEYKGRGVSYCAICDAMFFKDKKVAVVGGGDTAFSDALYLSNVVGEVIIIHRREQFRAAKYLVERAEKIKNIKFLKSRIVKRIEGENKVNKLILQNLKENKEEELDVDGVFISIGIKPNSDFVKGKLKLDENGFIVTDGNLESSDKKVFAAGDVRSGSVKQILTACAEGAIAALNLAKYF